MNIALAVARVGMTTASAEPAADWLGTNDLVEAIAWWKEQKVPVWGVIPERVGIAAGPEARLYGSCCFFDMAGTRHCANHDVLVDAEALSLT